MRVGVSDIIILIMVICLSSNIIILIMTMACRLLQDRVSIKYLDGILKNIILYLLFIQPFISGIIIYNTSFGGRLIAKSEDYNYYYLFEKKTFGLVYEKAFFRVFLTVFLIWVVGIILLGLWRFLCVRQIIRKIEKSGELLSDYIYQNIEKNLGNKEKYIHKIFLYQSNVVPAPFMKGIFKIKIFLPEIDLKTKERDLIIEHELQHIKKFDYFYRLAFFLLCSVYWFNPLIYYMADFFVTTNETACDERVLSGKSKEIRYLYAELMCRLSTARGLNMRYVTNFMGTQECVLESRLKNMKKETKRKGVMLFALTVASAICLCPVSTWAAAISITEIQNIAVETILGENSEEEIPSSVKGKELYGDFSKEGEKNRKTLKIASKGSSSVDLSLSSKEMAITDSIYLTKGSKVHFWVLSNSSASFTAGIVDEDGKSRYTTARSGEIDYTFTVQSGGYYDIYIENKSSSQIDVTGTIYTTN